MSATAPLWTAAEAARATRGITGPDWVATGVSIDTRTLQPGDLFVALRAARDGHDFVAQALDKGAAAALVSTVPPGVDLNDPRLLLVSNVLQALERLARAARARTGAKVIGITGSAGKTSTKEMMRAALAGQAKVHAAEKSYNNHWGVPLTLARMPADTEYAVIEIGMNHPGEIAPLARLADLDAAVVTLVAEAHLGAFADGVEGIAREKASIMAGLRPGAPAILNADVATAPILFDIARALPQRPLVLAFGTKAEQAGADGAALLRSVTLAEGQTVVQAEVLGAPVLFKLSSPGRHFAMNGLAVVTALAALEADLGRAVLDLGRWLPVDGRGVRERRILDTIEDDVGFDLIDDAYNANPASVAAALDMLSAIAPRDGIGRVAKGRRVAVLGDMLELGPRETELHAALAAHPAMAAIDTVHCVGPRMRALHDALPPEKRGTWHESAKKLAADARRLVDAGDVILVKGSLGVGLAVVVDALRKLGQAAPDAGSDGP